jgi:hypothetical protein
LCLQGDRAEGLLKVLLDIRAVAADWVGGAEPANDYKK